MGLPEKWLRLAGRGRRWSDRLAIVVFLLFRARPGFWRLVSRLTGERDYTITVATPLGPARLVFNPLHTSELTVVDELLPGDIYIAGSRADHFIDCGAFRGISTIYIQDQIKATRVIAYEPQGDNFSILDRRLAKFCPLASRRNAAVGAESSEAYFDGGGVGGSVGAKGKLVTVERRADELATLRSDGLLLKMDIEGAERDVLPDILPELPAHCSLFLETHFPTQYSRELLEPFRASGFSIRECRCRPDEGSATVFIDWALRRSGETHSA